jgi:branched-chain amino acid transport system substrate-binding protein
MTHAPKDLLARACGPILCAAVLASLAGAAEPVRIGFFMSMTGRDASFGEASLRGASMAVDGLNAAGGVLGRPVELVVEDNRSLAGESATAVKKLISRDRVVALIGECSSARSLEAAPVAQAAGIPMVSPASTNASVTEAGDAIFRMCFVDSFQGEVIGTFARKRLGLRRAAILIDSTAPYSVGLADYFSRTFTGLGGEIVATQRYAGADTDFRAQLTAIRAANPDALFLPGY